jgi:hypothetical protein
MSLNAAAKRIIDSIGKPANRLVEEIGAGIVYGIVTSVAPLKIQIEGTSKEIFEDFIVLSPFCPIPKKAAGEPFCDEAAEFDNYVETYEKSGGSGYPAYASHSHKFHVGLWRSLQVGDKLCMFMDSAKQVYVALWRVDMVFGDMGV